MTKLDDAIQRMLELPPVKELGGFLKGFELRWRFARIAQGTCFSQILHDAVAGRTGAQEVEVLYAMRKFGDLLGKAFDACMEEWRAHGWRAVAQDMAESEMLGEFVKDLPEFISHSLPAFLLHKTVKAFLRQPSLDSSLILYLWAQEQERNMEEFKVSAASLPTVIGLADILCCQEFCKPVQQYFEQRCMAPEAKDISKLREAHNEYRALVVIQSAAWLLHIHDQPGLPEKAKGLKEIIGKMFPSDDDSAFSFKKALFLPFLLGGSVLDQVLDQVNAREPFLIFSFMAAFDLNLFQVMLSSYRHDLVSKAAAKEQAEKKENDDQKAVEKEEVELKKMEQELRRMELEVKKQALQKQLQN